MTKNLTPIALIIVTLVTTAAAWPRRPLPPVKAQCLAPVLVGRVNLTTGIGEVRDPRIHAGMLVIFSVVSADSLSAGARVSVNQLDEGILVFWAHLFDSQGSTQTADEPEVHFSAWDSAGHGTWP